MRRRPLWHALVIAVAGLVLGAASIVPLQFTSATQPAAAADPANFNPGFIIADQYFYNADAMSADDIQSFLNARIGACANGACLNVLNVGFIGAARYVAAKTGTLVCAAIPTETVSAALFIYHVQQACGISARVLLVTLQKEQALISGSAAQAPSVGRLNIAMGYACPDTAACDTRYYGFANQVYWGAWQLKVYSANKFLVQPGNHYVQYSPNSSCGGTTVNIQNFATAALYNYTPYQPNAAALANLYGTGDSCSAYGNRNFWRYYSDWFGSPTGNPPTGWLDSATLSGSSVVATGWSIDIDDPVSPVRVQLKVDGAVAASGYANGNRPGLGAAVFPAAGDQHGYTLSATMSPGIHTVCLVALDNVSAAPVTLAYAGPGASKSCAVINYSG